ncbi:MAG TPA: choice-of-anchor J domain-containing protein, partial [Candidatus Cloacimonadota bacterium]|nr:choice-of-anchor J domain-containing protein [Candidatus Cloacimonadota bacterium]
MSSLFQMKRTMLVVFSLFLLLTSALWAQFPQGFEGGAIPTGWTVYNVDGDTKEFIAYNAGTAAQEGSWVAQVSWNAAGNNDWLVTPQINVTAENKVVKFWARSASSFYLEDFNVKLSTTGNAVADFTVNLASYLQIANEWTEYTVDLTTYVGSTVYLGIQVVSLDELTFRIDGFDWVLGNDLAALSIAGSNSPTVGTANDYVVTVKNNGGNAQSTYTVKFYVNDAEVATLPGTQIAAGATAPFTFSW